MSAPAYDEFFGTLFTEENREKLEWAIGAVLANGLKKFVVIHGPAASGKSSVIRIIQRIMYKQKVYPPVIFAHDGSRDAALKGYNGNSFVFVASLDPMGVVARDNSQPLVEISTTGDTLDSKVYFALQAQMEDEYETIAYRCAKRYLTLGATYYDNTTQENNK